jgi:hypothetical protein
LPSVDLAFKGSETVKASKAQQWTVEPSVIIIINSVIPGIITYFGFDLNWEKQFIVAVRNTLFKPNELDKVLLLLFIRLFTTRWLSKNICYSTFIPEMRIPAV